MGEGFGIAVSCGVGCRHCSDPALLWLWHGPASIVLIRPLAWEPPYAAGAAQVIAKRQKQKQQKQKNSCPNQNKYKFLKTGTNELKKNTVSYTAT